MLIIQNVAYRFQWIQDPDFEEDEYMYDDLNLEEEEELYPITTDDYFAHNESKWCILSLFFTERWLTDFLI